MKIIALYDVVELFSFFFGVSKSEVKRLWKAGALAHWQDGEDRYCVGPEVAQIEIQDEDVLQMGKRRFVRVRI